MKHLSRPIRRLPAILVALALLTAATATLADGPAVPHHEITYSYPLDFLLPGPQQGDPAQPRWDVSAAYGDATGRELADGVIPEWPADGLVGFNEYHGTGAGADVGLPQPRIEFDLGFARSLSSLTISYLTGGGGGILAPQRVEIQVSRDGGLTYSDLSAITYAGFNRTFDGTNFVSTDEIAFDAQDATHVRMDFYQDSHPSLWSTSLWVLLGEVTFYGGSNTGDLGACLLDLDSCTTDLDFCETDLQDAVDSADECAADFDEALDAAEQCDDSLQAARVQIDTGHAGMAEIIRLLGLPRGHRESEFACEGELCPQLLQTIEMLLESPGLNHHKPKQKKTKRQ